MNGSELAYMAFAESDALLPPVTMALKPLPTVVAGRYRIERVLGVGGMGAVYEVRDLLTEQFGGHSRLALKTLSEEFAEHPDGELLLYTEFALLNRLQHSNVVRLFAIDRDAQSGRLFLLLEVVKGISLSQVIAENPAGLAWPAAQHLAKQLLSGLAHCHARGVVHGDIKPGNVLVQGDFVRLIDFGLGQLAADDGTLPRIQRDRFAAWTPGYAAPEVRSGVRPSLSGDAFSAARVILELCTGRVTEPVQGKRSRPTGMPAGFWKALHAALDPSPARAASAQALLNELDHCSRVFRFFRR